MTQTQQSQIGGPLPVRPTVLTGRELYNQVMEHIEPELTTEGMKTLREKYKDETQEEKSKRGERYKLAFERCKKACEEYLTTLRAQADMYVHRRRDHLEAKDRAREAPRMDDLLGSVYQLT